MPVPGPGYSITVRLEAPPSASAAGDLASAVGKLGGVITAFDVVESHTDRIVVDITCNALSEGHARDITEELERLPGVAVRKVSDRTFLIHLGGKIEIRSKVALKNRDDLSRAYTPGVARICQAIAENPDDARRLTIKRNTVAVVTDGSAVLGLGNLGPAAALPVMEGKAALFKKFADVDAWPVCLDTQDTEEIIRTVVLLAPVYGGINLEDIAAPRCFEIEARLRELLDIPVFHDDQHGTAIVVTAALRNALRVVGKSMSDCRIVVCGAGAAGSAIVRLLLQRGPGEVIAVDVDGIVHSGRPGLDANLAWIAAQTNPSGMTGSLHDALVGADVFIGVSAPNLFGAEQVATMAPRAVVFALANPDPEIDPLEAQRYAAVVATGRSDYPNQINNVLAFPGVFRGLLDAQARTVTDEMLLAASAAIADVVAEPNPSFIVPSVFDAAVAPAVAECVRKAAAAHPILIWVSSVGELSHLDSSGAARMVDVSAKAATARTAVAAGIVRTTAEVVELLRRDGLPKGDALATARIAGIMAAKRTPDLIPLCHPIALSSVTVDLALAGTSVEITAVARTTDRTGVEMEALTAVAVAGLALHDMIKAVDPAAVLDAVRLVEKVGGKSGTWTRPEDR